MGTELPTKVMLGQTLVSMQMTFLNNVRKVGRLVLSRTSCDLLGRTYRIALQQILNASTTFSKTSIHRNFVTS
jgi:hypothetical protein